MLSLWLCFVSLAQAGEIQVSLGTPVVIYLDGQLLQQEAGTMMVTARGLGEGGHQVEARNLLGRLIATREVEVGATEQVRLRYAHKVLSEVGRGAAPPPPASPPATQNPVTAQIQAIEASIGLSPAPPLDTGLRPPTATVQARVEEPVGSPSESVSMSVTVDGVNMSATVQTSSSEVAAPGPSVISPAQLANLARAVEEATFGSDQVEVLRAAAAHNRFRCEQVVTLLEPLSHGGDKVEAVRALSGAVVDPQNAHIIESAFTFSSDKEVVRGMFP